MDAQRQYGPNIRMNKTCDQCRHRKTRCIVPEAPPGKVPTCISCTKRGQTCHFSVFRRKIRVKDSSSSTNQSALGDLFIDRILRHGPQEVVLEADFSVFTSPDEQVPTSGLAFFSEQKVASLSKKIGHSRLQDLVKRMDALILDRLGYSEESTWPAVNFDKPSNFEKPSPAEAHAFIQAYFEKIHPVYPFLDREDFEETSSSPALQETLDRNPAFSALYHTILALGCQFVHGGTFVPGKGKSWELYQVALGHMKDIILPRETLEHLQALAAMSIYSMNSCCLAIDDAISSQAARMLIPLRYHKNAFIEPKYLRAFWVVYALEKQQSFHSKTSSIIPDEDVGCIVPPYPEAEFEGFNWFVAYIRINRISSIISSTLFSVSASLRSKESYLSAIDNVRQILEEWRQTFPEKYRPGTSIQFPKSLPANVCLSALITHYSYYHIMLALERLTLHIGPEGGRKAQISKQSLMESARLIIEMTRYIDIQPYTPIIYLAMIPVSAVFVLFDFVIHNPYHRESRTNLALLDTAAGYFSLLDMTVGRSLPSGLMPEFTKIAREYYWQAQQTRLGGPPPLDEGMTTLGGGEGGGTENATAGSSQITGQWGSSVIPSDQSTQDDGSQHGSQTITPIGSDYLHYPTPMNYPLGSDFQNAESGDMRTMFGWGFGDWGMGGIGMDMDIGLSNYSPEGLVMDGTSLEGNTQVDDGMTSANMGLNMNALGLGNTSDTQEQPLDFQTQALGSQSDSTDIQGQSSLFQDQSSGYPRQL